MAASKPNILLLTTNLGLGGAQRVVRDHAAALSGRFPVEKAVFNLDGGDFYGDQKAFLSLEVRGGGTPIHKLVHFVQRVRRTRALKRRHRIDLCISHLEGADYINVLSRTGEKTILCVHGSKLGDANISGLTGWLRKAVLIPWLYNRADAIVTVSRDIVPELEALGVRKPEIVTINNFFDLDAIAKAADEPLAREEEALFAARPMLVTAGRLALQKNQAPLFDVLAAVKAKRAAGLLLLGEGELREQLAARARALGLTVCEADKGEPLGVDHDVWFMGSRQNPFKYVRRASLFLLPSGWEGFPMALCEAMACGLAVIASDCPTGPREILAPDTRSSGPLRSAEWAPYGVLAPILDAADVQQTGLAAWTDSILRLLDDSALRASLAEAGNRRVEDFRPEKIVEQWAALIERHC